MTESRSLHVLVAEDDADIGELVAMMLEDMGAQVTIATDGRVALDHLAEQTPDLLVCDLWMPQVDGFAVIDWCQQHLPQLKVAVMTAQREAEGDILGRPNVHAWLLKPFSMAHQAKLEDLVETIKQAS